MIERPDEESCPELEADSFSSKSWGHCFIANKHTKFPLLGSGNVLLPCMEARDPGRGWVSACLPLPPPTLRARGALVAPGAVWGGGKHNFNIGGGLENPKVQRFAVSSLKRQEQESGPSSLLPAVAIRQFPLLCLQHLWVQLQPRSGEQRKTEERRAQSWDLNPHPSMGGEGRAVLSSPKTSPHGAEQKLEPA